MIIHLLFFLLPTQNVISGSISGSTSDPLILKSSQTLWLTFAVNDGEHATNPEDDIKKALEYATDIDQDSFSLGDFNDYPGELDMQYSSLEISIDYDNMSHLKALQNWWNNRPEEFVTIFNDFMIDEVGGSMLISRKYFSYNWIADEDAGDFLHISQLIHPGYISHGLLQVYDNSAQLFRGFCNNTWGWTETQIACKNMGYHSGVYLAGNFDNYKSTDPYYGDVSCSGDESSLMDCTMTEDATNTVTDCPNTNYAVHISCIRYEPAFNWPVRQPKYWDQVTNFVPLIYGDYDDSNEDKWYTICEDSMSSVGHSLSEFADEMCVMFTDDHESTGTGFSTNNIDDLFYISQDLGVVDVNDVEGDENNFVLSTLSTCTNHQSDVYVECSSSQQCTAEGSPCTADTDCCTTSSVQLFCHPLHHECVNIRNVLKHDGYSPCFSSLECESFQCQDPGDFGICERGIESSDTCFNAWMQCFDDAQCCANLICEENNCQHDPYDGAEPHFTNLSPRRQRDITEWYIIKGFNLRYRMLFKLVANGDCGDDRSPYSNVPHNSHYADRGYLSETMTDISLETSQEFYFRIQILAPIAYGELSLCYAVNDYAPYEDTGYTISVRRLVSDTKIAYTLDATISWIQGSNILNENSATGYVEYELQLSRPLLEDEYVELDSFSDEWNSKLYPSGHFFYHKDRGYDDAIRITYDSGSSVDRAGYRDSGNWNVPINVKIHWYNDGTPEIMDRVFYVVHSAYCHLGTDLDYWSLDAFKLASIEFTMKDDDPQIQQSSLRKSGSTTGVLSLTGSQSGDENLIFLCDGCGDEPYLVDISYGPEDMINYYSGENIEISNTFTDDGEIDMSYIQFFTAYVQTDSPMENLKFEITVHSRFNYSLTKIMHPDFSFSYPTDIDAEAPVIDKIEGEGCENIGKRALNCPTDGKYSGDDAKIVLYGTHFPNETEYIVSVLIDGVECSDVQFSIEADLLTGLRNVSCKYGPGVSSYGTNGYSYVQLSYEYGDSHCISPKSSTPVRYFNYSYPSIIRIVGCSHSISDLHTGNCTRTGGGMASRLTIYGANFGTSGARVFIGGKEAVETVHDAAEPHGKLWVIYGPGTREHELIMIMTSKGGTTFTLAYVSYYQCPEGYHQMGFHCKACDPGSYTNTRNADVCFQCDAGEYATNNGSIECLSCPVGTFASGIGNSECSPCATGYYAPSLSSTECTECGEGQFNMNPSSSVCHNCDDNSFSIKSQRDKCLCESGYYEYASQLVSEESNATSVLCRECTDGMVCDTVGQNHTSVVPQAGWMPMINTQPETLEMMKCINNACVGGKRLCQDGFTGVLCTDCEEGLGKVSGHGCETCLPPGTNAVRLLGVILLVSILICYFIYSTIKTAEAEKSDISTIGKIGFSFLQFNSMALQFDYEFPSIVQTFLKIQEQPATVANGVLSVDCFVKNNENIALPSLYIKALCYLLLPLFIIFICRVVFVRYLKRNSRSSTYKIDLDITRRRSSLALLSRLELPKDSKAYSYVSAWNHYITAVIITIFMIHPSIVQQTFGMLNCKKLGAFDDDYYLIEDMTVQCWQSTHIVFVIFVAIPMLIFYVMGMPLFVLWRLYENRDELKKSFNSINKNILNRYHFLFKGYEPEFYYWEIIIMIRKVTMVCIAVFFAYDIQIQALLATLLVVIALCVHALACPYVTDAMDGLELLSLFGSFCTYFFGQFLFTESVSAAGKTIVSIIIVLVNFAMIATVSIMVGGKGLRMVSGISRKFRSICCGVGTKSSSKNARGKSSEPLHEGNDEGDKPRTPKKKKTRDAQMEKHDEFSYPVDQNRMRQVDSASPFVVNQIAVNDIPMIEHKENIVEEEMIPNAPNQDFAIANSSSFAY